LGISRTIYLFTEYNEETLALPRISFFMAEDTGYMMELVLMA
jgi:hypothetical protein